MLYHLHVFVSIITYTLGILFIANNRLLKKFTAPFIAAGKMSLSNYILQSVICSFIFTRYGLSLFAETTPTYNILIVLSIYSLQLVASCFYLRKYKTGPLEWLWHRMVY